MNAVGLVVRRRPAMSTWFEACLDGDDSEHLEAVADAVFDEVERVERLLSRHEPRSELSRVNRAATDGPVQIDREFLAILAACREAWRATAGAFDPAAGSGGSFAEVEVDEPHRRVRFRARGLALDLGGFGKGYALDRAVELVRAHGVTSARLHGGTSSVAAIGPGPGGEARGWPVRLRDPFCDPDLDSGLEPIWLRDRSLSCSSVFRPGETASDLIHPALGRPLDTAAACVALADSAARAEVLSTGFLVAGRSRLGPLLAGLGKREAVGWIAPGRDRGRPACAWFGGGAP